MRVTPAADGPAASPPAAAEALPSSSSTSSPRQRARSSTAGQPQPPAAPGLRRRGNSESENEHAGTGRGRWGWHSPFLRKPMTVVVGEEEEEKLERRMGLYDLLAVGIGGTVGSGVFVLAGEIANAPDLPAGPSVVLSFAAAGLGCVLSGFSFAELASRIHADGSSYIYSYVNLGEVFAFVAGWYVHGRRDNKGVCLTGDVSTS